MFIRAYLRASTQEQDATRARGQLEGFARQHGQAIAATYIENESGARVDRPELTRLLRDSHPGDVLLIEAIDRLSRLEDDAWRSLKQAIDDRGLRIVALDLPTSHKAMVPDSGDEFTDWMLNAINSMLIDVMAALARKDFRLRRDRQAQGIQKAKAAGMYKGRPRDEDLHRRIKELLAKDFGIRATARLAKCSTTTVLKVRDELVKEKPDA